LQPPLTLRVRSKPSLRRSIRVNRRHVDPLDPLINDVRCSIPDAIAARTALVAQLRSTLKKESDLYKYLAKPRTLAMDVSGRAALPAPVFHRRF
jgi:hypothetical protein